MMCQHCVHNLGYCRVKCQHHWIALVQVEYSGYLKHELKMLL